MYLSIIDFEILKQTKLEILMENNYCEANHIYFTITFYS